MCGDKDGLEACNDLLYHILMTSHCVHVLVSNWNIGTASTCSFKNLSESRKGFRNYTRASNKNATVAASEKWDYTTTLSYPTADVTKFSNKRLIYSPVLRYAKQSN